MKRYLLLGFLILNTSIILAQKSSLNAGFDLLGLKDQTPYGAGFRLGCEFAIPKINFFTLEARIGAGKLMNDGLYQVEPILKEWSCAASYFRVGVCPRFYYRMASKYLSYSVSLYGFPRNYAYMFNSLNIAGCSYSDMESSLCTYSVSDFRDKLIAKYPSLQVKITEITNAYL